MEWWLVLVLIFASLLVVIATGMPVAFCFILVNLVGAFLLFGGETGLEYLILSIRDSIMTFSLLPLLLFVMMGEVIFHSGIGPLMMDALDKWLGRVPGRLSLLAVGGGTLLSTLTGATMGSVAILGSVLVPEMETRGYKKSMTLGPILGSGCLAIMIPPSALAILLGVVGEISIGKILLAIIIPGILLAVLYGVYIITRCSLQPSIAPAYDVPPVPFWDRIITTVRYILPIGFIIFMVLGVIFLGIATPSEAAATGALGCFILAACFGRLNWEMVKKSIGSTVSIAVMVLMIMVGARTFAQILAFSGATHGMSEFAMGLPLSPILLLIAMQVVVIIIGMFIDSLSIMMITLPIFMPIIHALGFDPVWFAVIFLINVDMGTITPPYGMTLFVMKGVAPRDTTMIDIIRSAIPFILLDLLAMALIIALPQLALWLPSMKF